MPILFVCTGWQRIPLNLMREVVQQGSMSQTAESTPAELSNAMLDGPCSWIRNPSETWISKHLIIRNAIEQSLLMGNHTPWQISTFFSFARAQNSFQNQWICLRWTSSCFSKAAFSAVPREPELLFSKKHFATKSSLLIMTWKDLRLISQWPIQKKQCTHFVDPLHSSFCQHGSCNQGWFNDATLPGSLNSRHDGLMAGHVVFWHVF